MTAGRAALGLVAVMAAAAAVVGIAVVIAASDPAPETSAPTTTSTTAGSTATTTTAGSTATTTSAGPTATTTTRDPLAEQCAAAYAAAAVAIEHYLLAREETARLMRDTSALDVAALDAAADAYHATDIARINALLALDVLTRAAPTGDRVRPPPGCTAADIADAAADIDTIEESWEIQSEICRQAKTVIVWWSIRC